MDYEDRQILEDEYASLIKQREEYVDSYNKAMKEFDDKLEKKKEEIMLNSKYLIEASKFNPDFIGPFIAELISFVKQEDYLYEKCNCMTKRTYFKDYEDYAYTSDFEPYIIYLVARKQDIYWVYQDDRRGLSNGKPLTNFKSLYPNVLELGRIKAIYQKHEKIRFYALKEDKNSYLSVQRNVALDEYPYVYNFIDELIKYRLNNNLDIQSEKVEEILEIFINNYKKDSVSSKKKGV